MSGRRPGVCGGQSRVRLGLEVQNQALGRQGGKDGECLRDSTGKISRSQIMKNFVRRSDVIPGGRPRKGFKQGSGTVSIAS